MEDLSRGGSRLEMDPGGRSPETEKTLDEGRFESRSRGLGVMKPEE